MQNANLVELHKAMKAILLPDIYDNDREDRELFDVVAYREAVAKAMDDFNEAAQKFEAALLEFHHFDSYLVGNLYKIDGCYYVVRNGKVELRFCIEITE